MLAHDGFFTASATSAEVELPEAPPIVTILYPGETDQVYAERQLHLWGTASGTTGEALADEAFSWQVDGVGVGRGRDLWVASPGPGRHRVRLEVAGRAGAGVAASTFEVPEGDG